MREHTYRHKRQKSKRKKKGEINIGKPQYKQKLNDWWTITLCLLLLPLPVDVVAVVFVASFRTRVRSAVVVVRAWLEAHSKARSKQHPIIISKGTNQIIPLFRTPVAPGVGGTGRFGFPSRCCLGGDDGAGRRGGDGERGEAPRFGFSCASVLMAPLPPGVIEAGRGGGGGERARSGSDGGFTGAETATVLRFAPLSIVVPAAPPLPPPPIIITVDRCGSSGMGLRGLVACCIGARRGLMARCGGAGIDFRGGWGGAPAPPIARAPPPPLPACDGTGWELRREIGLLVPIPLLLAVVSFLLVLLKMLVPFSSLLVPFSPRLIPYQDRTR